ncbi:MAG: colanic acid biosynthesis glycosyltransferase WcaL [Gordonia sp. (in: high G+C Gram-positive bacteria)]|nr:MAG: colanic acid biosynthesis glycosyltransferase WcaL [Gordonia sp. (in: high G+C Gram-positive bacteria)]
MSKPEIVYMVSRFPRTSETFIVRELDGLAGLGRFDVSVRSLFPSPDTAVHSVAERWAAVLVRPGAVAIARGVFWALVRHPLAFLGVLATVIGEHLRAPRLGARALVTTAIGCAHARDLAPRSRSAHIHAHYATYPALAAWVCHRLTGISYSFTAHAHDLYVDQVMLGRKVSDAALVVTISDFNRAILTGLHTGTDVHVVHCGINTSGYRFEPRVIPAQGPIRAVCVASLQEYKGHEVLLCALAKGGPGVGRIQLDLIGDGPLRDELEQLSLELGLADRVRFLGAQTETVVAAKLAAAELFVLPSVVAADGQMEGLPVALMEALASGLPCVSTSLSGIPEIIVDGVTGRLARPGDAKDLRDALESVVSGGEDVAGYAAAGRALVEQDFDLRTTVEKLADLLEPVFTNRRD